jgi:peroxiredoxin family protein
MGNRKSFGIVAAAAVVAILLAANTASAAALYRDTGGTTDTLGVGTTINWSLKSASSLIFQDTNSLTQDTCSGSEAVGELKVAKGESISLPLSLLTLSSCTHTSHVLANGSISISRIGSTKNGTVSSSGAEVTVKSTFFGVSITCKTGSGADIGTLTGAEAGGHATLDINAVISCGSLLPTAKLEGTYTVTSPTGLIVGEDSEPDPDPEPGTEFYRDTGSTTDTLGVGTPIKASLESGTSLVLVDTNGLTQDTCSGSEASGEIEEPGGEEAEPGGKLSTLTFSPCTHTTHVLKTGSISISRIGSTKNGTVSSSGAEVTVKSTVFGTSIVCKTGAGTDLGTLTGTEVGGHATLDIAAVVSCGSFVPTAKLEGTYTVTSPTGLIVGGDSEPEPEPGTELYRDTGSTTDTLGVGTPIKASLESGTSLVLVDTNGLTQDTCSGSEASGEIEEPGGEESNPGGNLSTLTFSPCTHTTHVLEPGSVSISQIGSGTQGTVVSTGAEVTVKSTIFGISIVCKTGAGTDLGTLTSAEPSGHARLHLKAVVACGSFSPTAKLEGTYTVTSPTGLIVEGA